MVKLNALFVLLMTLLARSSFKPACRLVSGSRLFIQPSCYIIGCLPRQSQIVFPFAPYLAWTLRMPVFGFSDVYATPTPPPLRCTSLRLAQCPVCSSGIHPSITAIAALIALPRRSSSPVMSWSMRPASPLPPLRLRHPRLLPCTLIISCRLLSSRCRSSCQARYHWPRVQPRHPQHHRPQAPPRRCRHRHGRPRHGHPRQGCCRHLL